MKFLIVCKWNQIRSTFLAEYLNNLFPEVQFESCGIKADQQSWSLNDLSTISKNFGFEYNPHQCVRYDEMLLDDYQAIIAVDQAVFEFITKKNKINAHQDSTRIVNLAKYVPSKYLIPKDPGSNKALNTQNELKKLISAFINYYHFHREPGITCYIPKNEKQIARTQFIAQVAMVKDKSSFFTIDFNTLDLQNNLALTVSNIGLRLDDVVSVDGLRAYFLEALQNRYSAFENILVDVNYVRKLIALTEEQKLCIITPPLLNSSQFNSLTLALSIPASKVLVT